MQTDTAKLTIRLPREDLDFAKAFVKAHGVSVTEVIDRYLRSLRRQEEKPEPEVQRITGLIPADVDGMEAYRSHLHEKHST
ncbi:DUF6364 family protein [Thauera aromatica]|uniref:DUF6364 family protein n=1 Tax=Thauera aromatica TaxID=59405 RepID=UPI001FFD1AEB|nr:DUF6364 family protein [Thauera aromatica]MCK2097681.1 DUF6364 family protein [Thauera aromatica]